MEKPYDCHTHIYDDAFSADFEQMLARAKKVLSGIIVVGEGPASNRKVLALCARYPKFLFPGLAIHPDKVHTLTDAEIDAEIDFIRKQKNLACIGECGLDYLWARKSENFEETKLKQQETFCKFIALADKMKLPLNIHSRRADSVVVKILKELRPKKAVLHGFSGSLAEAKEMVTRGYKIVIGTNLFFSKETKGYVEGLPLEAFVLETDSPVQAPVRGQRNEPANVSLVVKEITKLKNINEADVIDSTNNSVKEIFNII
ncbi:MAG: TatD family hydrolase [DPANN group archaeon]|nr:TatD family hydrolase [DPANN group archaeon]